MKTFNFKKVMAIFFIASTVLFIASCQQSENIETPSGTQEIIDYDVTKTPCDMTVEETQAAQEAFEMMDNHIVLEKDQYVLKATNGLSLGLSERVFNHYKARMEQTNEMLKGAVLIPIDGKKVEIRCLGYSPISTRAAGGETKIVSDWYSFDLYLSNKTLVSLAAGAGLAGTLAGLAPDPTVTKIVATVAGFCSFTFSMLANYYPNGVIISCVYVPLPTVGCIPYDINGQR